MIRFLINGVLLRFAANVKAQSCSATPSSNEMINICFPDDIDEVIATKPYRYHIFATYLFQNFDITLCKLVDLVGISAGFLHPFDIIVSESRVRLDRFETGFK